VSHERQQLGGVGVTVNFAAVICTANEQRALFLIEIESDRHNSFLLFTQNIFEQRMTGLAQDEAAAIIRTDARDYAAELARKLGFGEDQFQTRQSLGGGRNRGRMQAQPGGELAQDAVDFARLLFSKAHQLVVELNGFERFDEKRVAAAAGPVNHAINAPLAAGDNGNHEAVIADGYEVFLQRAVRMMRAQKALERMLDSLALLFDVTPQPPQRDTCVIRQNAAGKNLAAQFLRQFAQIGDRAAVRRQTRESLAGGDQDSARLGGQLQQTRELVDLLRFERCAFDPEPFNGSRGICNIGKADTDRRAS
jgi:hypothetical protein